MKLSEKGLGKLYNSKACYYDPDTEEEVVALSYFEHVFEFEPDDFKDSVILSIEEAKILENFCWRYASFLSPEEDAVHDKLVEQINQVEVIR